MADFDTHMEKYELFKKDSYNESISHPLRIEALFAASFHIIEACFAKQNIHINKHQLTRRFVTDHIELFKDKSDDIWRNFQILENQIRPGQEYGGKINGQELNKAKEIFERIEKICHEVLSHDSG